MDDWKDQAAGDYRTPTYRAVTWKPPRRKIRVTVTECAALLRISVRAVRTILAQGRIVGAYRTKGKNRPWVIPTKLQPDGRHLPTIRPGKRGPLLGAYARGDALAPPTSPEVPF